MSANDYQEGGSHYSGTELQHWDLVAMYEWDYFQGQITKYLMRWRKKGGILDLKKAAHFLEKYIEIEEAKVNSKTIHGIFGGQTICGAVVNGNRGPVTCDKCIDIIQKRPLSQTEEKMKQEK